MKLASLPVWMQQRKPKKKQGLQTRKPLKRKKALRSHKPGQRPLQHKRQVFGVTVKRVRSTGYTWKRGKPIARDGVRGRRLLAADAKARAKVKNLPCLCGCNCTKPQWMHLKGRSDLRYRHEDWATAPGCEHLHGWLDQGKGVKARGEMFDLAKTLGRRLEHADVYSLLVDHGYYAELDRKRAMER